MGFAPMPGGYGMPPKKPNKWRPILLTLLAVGTFVGIVLVGLFLIAAVVGAASSSSTDAVVQNVVSTGDRAETVAVIPVRGLIVDETEKLFRRHLATAAKDNNVKAIVIDVSSPGGTVTDSNQMYQALLDFKADKQVPVIVHFDDVAASGGYYIACAADTIFAEETTITGSIGVLIQYPQLSGFAEKTGIKLQTIVADGSPRKDFLDTFAEPDEQDLSDVKALLNEQYDLFRAVVEAGRGGQITSAGATLDEVASGAVFVGQRAVDLGLVDQLGFLDDATGFAATTAGLTKPHIVRYDRQPTALEALGLATAPELKLDAESAKSLAVELLHEASSPRMLFLYNGVR